MSLLVNKTNQRVRHPFMFHYAFLVAYREVLGSPIVANCFKLLLKQN
jgi:hypothetical protein